MKIKKKNYSPEEQAKLFRQFASWSKEQKLKYLKKLLAIDVLEYHQTWCAWARDNQLAPPGNWSTWVVKAGRGWGKTRTGAEWIIEKAKTYPGCHIALVGRTVADVRDVMVKGRSGILSISPYSFQPTYYPSKRLIVWPNGSYATTYSAEEPDQLRGPQHSFAWGDELASWQYWDAFDQLSFGLRIYPAPGVEPQAIFTTTPRNTKEIKALLADPSTVVTNGSTYDNRENLSKRFIHEIDRKYKGTRLGKQEIDGDVVDDIDGALWKRKWIDDNRVRECPALKRIVVAVDPPATSLETSEDPAEAGIIVAGLGVDNHGYMLADYSMVGTPNEWASAAVKAYDAFQADCIVGEVNFGGEMVGTIIRNIAKERSLGSIKFKAVRASRGKQLRAEPISDLAQRALIHHVGVFSDTEDQMCFAGDTRVACDDGWKRIDSIQPGEMVWTRDGLHRVVRSECTNKSAKVSRLRTTNDRYLVATMGHPVYNRDRGEFVPLGSLQQGDTLEVFSWQKAVGDGVQKELMAPPGESENMAHKLSGTGGCGELMDLMGTIGMQRVNCCIEQFGKMLMGQFQKIAKFITKMRINRIIDLITYNWLRVQSIPLYSIVVGLPGVQNSDHKVFAPMFGRNDSLKTMCVNTVIPHSRVQTCVPAGVQSDVVVSLEAIEERIPVYNLEVEGCHEYYANGILVHNCNWVPGERSPDRLDGHVWAFTELMGGKNAVGGMVVHKPTEEEKERELYEEEDELAWR